MESAPVPRRMNRPSAAAAFLSHVKPVLAAGPRVKGSCSLRVRPGFQLVASGLRLGLRQLVTTEQRLRLRRLDSSSGKPRTAAAKSFQQEAESRDSAYGKNSSGEKGGKGTGSKLAVTQRSKLAGPVRQQSLRKSPRALTAGRRRQTARWRRIIKGTEPPLRRRPK
ncbi:hypothetical protein CDD83_9285 [Cordyceps sp. RAO-2017]|nr:hypothetical protein CDD83_9285 [Cordyceps sp. RAO-2017]